MHDLSLLLLGASGSNAALVTFVLYMVGVFIIAGFANRLMQHKEFLSEYFLGSRSLGVWAFALTFAATSASGGTFTGFPAKIYTHGWVMALWISSYMVVPICTMGLLGKRVNQVARISGAITVPDFLRDRYDSRTFGLISTLLIVFFMAFNLIAQFKAGSLILNTLLVDVPVYQSAIADLNEFSQQHRQAWWLASFFPPDMPLDWGYLLCLVVFGITVVWYTTYGGFHAVVWTDVMQGVVMVAGVLIMLPLAISQAGGLNQATRSLAEMSPPVSCTVTLAIPAENSQKLIPRGSMVQMVIPGSELPRLFRITDAATLSSATNGQLQVPALEIITPAEIQRFLKHHADQIQAAQVTSVSNEKRYAYGAEESQKGAYVRAPGPSPTAADGFLPLGAAISFFFMWAISGTGQPQYMVRLMAFDSSRTLQNSMVTVTIYFGLIYFPLVIIFCCSRVLLPGLEYDPDSIMPRMAVYLTESVGHGWLAGLLIAAPFAAVMSTVDSFLLVVSSALVQDIWLRNVNPHASMKFVKWLSYLTTLAVGTFAMLGAVNPPGFLQDMIVYTGSGLASCFLFPIAACLYWPRSNAQGCLGGMLAGFGIHLGMHLIGMFQENGSFVKPYELLGFSPVVIGLATSLVATVVFTLITPPPREDLVRKFFCKPSPKNS